MHGRTRSRNFPRTRTKLTARSPTLPIPSKFLPLALPGNDGYTYSTLHTIPREKWESMGVAMGSIEQLETKLHGLRHDNFQTMIGPNGQVTSIATGMDVFR